MKQGVLYKATGKKYISEVEMSAKSIKNVMPDMNTALITDSNCSGVKYIDQVIMSKNKLNNDNSSNILYPDKSPFEQTIYLDTDTYVHQDVTELFDILKKVNLGVTIAPNRKETPNLGEPYKNFSGGILVFDDSNDVDSFFRMWHDCYWSHRKNSNILKNQPSLSESIIKSGISHHVLPREYNVYANRGSSVGFVYNDVKILHGRPQYLLPRIANDINSKSGRRVYYVSPSIVREYKIIQINPSSFSMCKRIYNSLSTKGIRSTIVSAGKKIYLFRDK